MFDWDSTGIGGGMIPRNEKKCWASLGQLIFYFVFSALWNRNYFLLLQLRSDFWKVMVPFSIVKPLNSTAIVCRWPAASARQAPTPPDKLLTHARQGPQLHRSEFYCRLGSQICLGYSTLHYMPISVYRYEIKQTFKSENPCFWFRIETSFFTSMLIRIQGVQPIRIRAEQYLVRLFHYWKLNFYIKNSKIHLV